MSLYETIHTKPMAMVLKSAFLEHPLYERYRSIRLCTFWTRVVSSAWFVRRRMAILINRTWLVVALRLKTSVSLGLDHATNETKRVRPQRTILIGQTSTTKN